LCTVAWMALIFFLSSFHDLRSPLPTLWDTLLRKSVHAGEYAVLYFFLWQALEKQKNRVLTTMLITLAYAMSDELHQGFVSGRHPAVLDVCIDFTGALLAAALLKPRSERGLS